MIWWLKNRRPDRWRDVQNTEAQHRLYIISELPLTEEEWIQQHASNAEQLELEAAPVDASACYPLTSMQSDVVVRNNE